MGKRRWVVVAIAALFGAAPARGQSAPGAATQRQGERRAPQRTVSEDLAHLEKELRLAAEQARVTAERLARQAGQGAETARRQLRESLPTLQQEVDKLGRSLRQLEDALAREGRAVRGTLTTLDTTRIVVTDGTGQRQTLAVDARTYAVRGGIEIDLDGLQPGSQLRVTFVDAKGERRAREVELLE